MLPASPAAASPAAAPQPALDLASTVFLATVAVLIVGFAWENHYSRRTTAILPQKRRAAILKEQAERGYLDGKLQPAR